jgi:N-acetylglucosaminyldiphosphoundecaprenol N-acetyl-beta-D-mannosaminyltransferase
VARPVGKRSSRVNVLGVDVDPVTVGELHAAIKRLVESGERGTVLNVNANCLNLLYTDAVLRRFFDGADLVFCDGAGVMLAARLLGRRLPERITYADWTWQLAAFAEAEGLSLFLLGAGPGVAERAAQRLRTLHPDLRISGIEHGFFDHSPGSRENEAILRKVNAAGPDILLVGLEMPLQERWLMDNRDAIDANVVLTGGAVFDYVSGRLQRGPRLLTDHGFEWLARLIVEPRRLWRRYLIGNPLFLLRVLRQRLGKGRFAGTPGGSRQT